MGRKFGSIGLAINSHRIVITAQLASETNVIGAGTVELHQRVLEIIKQFYASLGQSIPLEKQGVLVELIELIPSHAGLGSGTQLALALGTALSQLYQVSATTQYIAEQLGRGTRSGIGIASFDHGGFIIDGGLGSGSSTPPLLVRYDFPQNWRVVMIMDTGNQGIHGKQELHAFDSLTPFPLTESQTICHLVLMQLLPAIVEKNITSFGQAITDIQSLIGDHFAPAQGGRYTSQRVASLLHYAQQQGHTGIAQSSWGPTGCIFVPNDHIAKQLITDLSHYVKQQQISDKELLFITAKVNKEGAKIEVLAS